MEVNQLGVAPYEKDHETHIHTLAAPQLNQYIQHRAPKLSLKQPTTSVQLSIPTKLKSIIYKFDIHPVANPLNNSLDDPQQCHESLV